jgi:hypothetical protein
VHAHEKLTAFIELESAIRGSLFAYWQTFLVNGGESFHSLSVTSPQSLASPNLLHFSRNVAPDFLQYISGIQSREAQTDERKFEL